MRLVLVYVPVKIIEPLVIWDTPGARIAQRPFADSPGLVACLFKDFSDGQVVRTQPYLVRDIITNAVVSVMHPRHQAAP